MKHKLSGILAICALLGSFSAEAVPEQRANASKVLRDVPYEFQMYDAVNSRMLYNDSLPGVIRGVGGVVVDEEEAETGGDDDDFSTRKKMPNDVEDARREAIESKKMRELNEKERLQQRFADNLGLSMPEGSRITYDDRIGKLTIRSSKEDIRTVEKALADFKELEGWFKKQLSDTNPISGSCYSNPNAVFLVTVTDALLEAYTQDDKKKAKGRKAKKKKARRGGKQNKEDEVIAALDKKRVMIFVFDKNVSSQKVMTFREQMKIKDCICVYESELSEGFAELLDEGTVVMVSCYGEVVDTFTSLNSIKSRVKDISFWHQQGARREYHR